MERIHISRGERNRSISVKALGQMFEELIRLSQTVAGSSECTCKLNQLKHLNGGDRGVAINNAIVRILKSKDKNGGDQNKPVVTSVDGTHVKNRKQFFEEQAHASENTNNIRNKTEINFAPSSSSRYSSISRLEDRSYLRSRNSKDFQPVSVKSKKQLFEEYKNGPDNGKFTSAKSTENLSYQPKSYGSSNLNGYLGGKRANTMNDLLSQKYDDTQSKTDDNTRKYSYTNQEGPSQKYDWMLEENLIKTAAETNNNHVGYVNIDSLDINLSEGKTESSSDEDEDITFMEYQNLPPPPADLLRSVQNDEIYQNFFSAQQQDEAQQITDDPVPTAKFFEIEDEAGKKSTANLIELDEANEEYIPQTRNIITLRNITTYTFDTEEEFVPNDEEPIYENEEFVPNDEEPIYENVPRNGIKPETTNEEIYEAVPVVCDVYDEAVYDDAVYDEAVYEEPEKLEENASNDNIEECISNVTEAFQSIQTLCNEPKWNVWDVAKQVHKFQDEEDERDIFGTLLDIDSDYCLETINSGNENVLFRISIGREVLLQEPADYTELLNSTEVDAGDKTNYEEPEYYSITDTSYDNDKDMSGTFFDKNKNPRIEIIGGNKNQETFLPMLKIPKMQYMIIKELIDSEENYLKRMKYIIDNYLIYFRSMDVSPDIEFVFEVYNETEKVYLALKESVSIEEIARVFLAHVHLFDCYTEHLRNKNKSQQYATKNFADVIKQRQLELEDQYTCESYLLNTTHRPEQYRLLLERLKKAVARNDESCESLDEAILLIDRKISEINTALAIESIRFHPGNLKQMGPFIMKEKFFIKRKYNSIVYLFQGGVVFCVEDQCNPDQCEYVECIEMDKLLLRHCSTSTSFQLSSFDKSKKYVDNSHDFDLEAPSMAIKEKWVDEIQRILWVQLQYYKDQQKNATLKQPKLPLQTDLPEEDVENNIYEDVLPPIDNNEYTNTIDATDNDEPEYCAIEESNYYSECAQIGGTFFDKDENPRIEIIGTDSTADNIYMQNVPKAQYMIIKELINTEETYLRKMRHIIDDYYIHFKRTGVPPDISIVFGNIETIYAETERLYSTLLECNSVEDIAKVFLNNASIFDLYTDYLRNKSISYYYASTKFKDIIKDRQAELEDQYTCDSYLLNPVQRPGRYRLLLEKLEKELAKTGETCQALSDAVKLVSDKITEANTLMTIDSIKKCPINLKTMGPFIMKEAFNIKRKYKSVVFLFKNIVVFCIEHQNRLDTYVYANSIELTELSLSHNRSSTSFQLRNFDKSRMGEDTRYCFDIEAPSMSVKERWIDEIQRLLWSQLQYFKDQQKRVSEVGIPPPMMRKGSMKVKSKPYDSPSKTHKRSTFYYDIATTMR
ncbi:RhoGEF domain [Popillia japonica]|uniref:RhoGEF domain n=1 Tax=Popillia japonica TaxID=7064 RepID=A0AAW1L7G8_POPJA